MISELLILLKLLSFSSSKLSPFKKLSPSFAFDLIIFDKSHIYALDVFLHRGHNIMIASYKSYSFFS